MGKELVIVQKRYTFKSMWALVFNYMDEVNRVWCGWLCGTNVGPLYHFHFSDFKRENSAPIFPPSLQHDASALVWLLPDWKPVKACQSYILCYIFDSSHHVSLICRWFDWGLWVGFFFLLLLFLVFTWWICPYGIVSKTRRKTLVPYSNRITGFSKPLLLFCFRVPGCSDKTPSAL